MSLANELRKIANRLDVPGAAAAYRHHVPLDLYRSFERLKSRTAFRTILDVGANRGEFSRYALACFPDAAIHAFEPLPGCQEALRRLAQTQPRVQAHSVALGETSGTVEMFENDYAPSSSLLPMLDRHRELWPKTSRDHKISVPVVTLDGIAFHQPFAPAIFLKLDVQGYELHVLKGALQVLQNTSAVLMEVLFEPLYDGQPDFRELLNFMAEQGFRFLEFADERRLPPSGKLIYADALFAKVDLIQ